jgi:hypothetical protein
MVKREFIVERQGRSFVLYAGLLDLAHTQGLRAIRTRLLQVPADDNGLTAIVSAEVETDRGTFSGIGDANPANVSRMMLTCTIRLAETRAKARALRDAVNVGVTAFEELGEQDDLVSAATDNRPLTWTNGSGGPTAGPTIDDAARAAPQAPTLATPAQVRAIYSIGRDQHNLAENEVDEKSTSLFGLAPSELSKKQASDLITSLKGSR